VHELRSYKSSIGNHSSQGWFPFFRHKDDVSGIAGAGFGWRELFRSDAETCAATVVDFSPGWMARTLKLWNFQEAFIKRVMKGVTKAGYPCRNPECEPA
jgi:hypothetical protein